MQCRAKSIIFMWPPRDTTFYIDVVVYHVKKIVFPFCVLRKKSTNLCNACYVIIAGFVENNAAGATLHNRKKTENFIDLDNGVPMIEFALKMSVNNIKVFVTTPPTNCRFKIRARYQLTVCTLIPKKDFAEDFAELAEYETGANSIKDDLP